MKIRNIFLVIGVIAILGLGYYGVAPIFTNVALDESLPDGMEMDEMEEVKAAEVVGTVGHPASGTVRALEVDGETYIRYEDFETLNGPDLFVYLAKDLNANEFVNLGKLRATEGNINYKVPEDIDVSEYQYVMVWCRAFSTLFNYADISN